MLPIKQDAATSAPVRGVPLDSLIAQFDTNPFAISRVIRQMRDADTASFIKSALRVIAEAPESSGIRFTATLVPLSEPILELIANPKAFDHDGARRIVEVMRRIDTQTEAKLLRLIIANPAKPIASEMADRILDIVDAITDGPRLVPVLMQIFRSANPYLRARLSLSIGKHHRNKDWIEDRMRDTDPRVRANAVEANWFHQDDSAVSLFNLALRDNHHRVVLNGAVGLYYAGDVRCLRVFGDLLANPNSRWRAAALWAIGHLQDTRFQTQVSGLAEDLDVMVRRTFEVAMGRLKRAAELRAVQPKLQMRLIKATRQNLPSADTTAAPRLQNHLFIEVKQSEGAAPVQGLKPLQFHIWENSHPVLDYSVQERTSYIKPGTYDIYFTVAAGADTLEIEGRKTAIRRLQVTVLTEDAFGELDSYNFGETAEVKPATAEPAETHVWNAFQ